MSRIKPADKNGIEVANLKRIVNLSSAKTSLLPIVEVLSRGKFIDTPAVFQSVIDSGAVRVNLKQVRVFIETEGEKWGPSHLS